MSEVINKPRLCKAKVKKLEPMLDKVYRIFLELNCVADFLPGQYLEIKVTEGHWQAFSIASLPGSSEVQLHIQYLADRENSIKLFEQLKEGANIEVRLASGECYLQGEDRPLVLVAAGTGFSQIKALVEALIEKNWQSPVSFYWAANKLDGLYNLPQAVAWQKQLANFTLIPVLENPPPVWQGRVGLVTDALASDFPEEKSAAYVEGFICGSPNMVYAVEDLLMSRGMPPRGLLSDAHAYAPRNI